MAYRIADGWYTGEAADEVLRSIDEANDRDWSDAYEDTMTKILLNFWDVNTAEHCGRIFATETAALKAARKLKANRKAAYFEIERVTVETQRTLSDDELAPDANLQVEDWQKEVASGATRLGYDDWRIAHWHIAPRKEK